MSAADFLSRAQVSELTTAEQLKRRDGGGCKTMDMNTGKSGSNDLSEPPLRARQVGPSFIHPPAALPALTVSV